MGTLLVMSPTPWIEAPLRRSLAAGAGVLLILIPAMTYWEWTRAGKMRRTRRS